MSTMSRPHPTELTVLFQRRPGTGHLRRGIKFAEYDFFWSDGRAVRLGLSHFCNFGSRLLLGRRCEGVSTLLRLTLHPVAGLEAALTRSGSGVRCRRLYALRCGDTIRLHLLDGTPTEVVFHTSCDEPKVIRWLQAECIRPGEPFWFDLVSQTLTEQCCPA
jgi:hypothetical protein